VGEVDRIDLDDFRRRFEAIGRQDWDTAAGLLDPGIEWHDPSEVPDAGVHVGLDAVRRYWAEELLDAWETWDLQLETLIPASDRILSISRLRGKGKHTGITVDMELFQVWTFKDGLVIEQRGFFDREQAFAAAGIDPGEG
jgi:ketosteroid isomerase-like protein